jgi:hypothetical protein
MSDGRASPTRPRVLCGLATAAALLVPGTARAWSIGTQLDEDGCHESITAQALIAARTRFATAPELTPTRDEAALIADVLFKPAGELRGDIGGMSLLLGVRDNDVKDKDPLAALDVVTLQGDPATQEEHCMRAAEDDGAAGEARSMDVCRAFIKMRAMQALDGLDASGTVDPDRRIELAVYLGFAGRVVPRLPLFYVRMGQAMHALEDGFTHTYRTGDGLRVTTVLNWVEFVGNDFDPARDGPGHHPPLDHCHGGDPLVLRNYHNAIDAATALMEVALDPSLSRDQKAAGFDAVTAKYLTFEDHGCTLDNGWCDAPEEQVTDPSALGCDAGAGGGGASSWLVLVIGAAALVILRRRGAMLLAIGLVMTAQVARADDRKRTAATEHEVATTPIPPAVVAPPAAGQTEPGRDVPTPTVHEVLQVRKDKRLGPALGFTGAVGVSVDRAAGVGTLGVRYRLNETWLVGGDVAWNPWISSSPNRFTSGSLNIYGTLIRRYPMRFDRVNLRTSLHLGTSTLLFDVYGAPKYSTGPYFAVSLLGIDYDLGGSVRLVVDPAEIAVPMPEVGQLPLWYSQFRFMVGLQYGS